MARSADLLGVAGAEPAKPVAVRDVDIERDFRVRGKRDEPLPIGLAGDARVEMRRRRIAGVTGIGAAYCSESSFCMAKIPDFCAILARRQAQATLIEIKVFTVGDKLPRDLVPATR